MSRLIAEHRLGDMVARYVQPTGSKRCELHLIPFSKLSQVVAPRQKIENRPEIDGLPEKFKPIAADGPNNLLQLKLLQDDYGGGFSAGTTMAESRTMKNLEYETQNVHREADGICVETSLRDEEGRFRCLHQLHYTHGARGLRSRVEFINTSKDTLSLELLTSFALNGLTPFSSGNSTPHLVFHRFRSWWSLEGRTDSASLESLHLERSWGGFGLFSERFGQVGSMPVRRWFPCAAVEDRTTGTVWAAQIAWAGSWQMELLRRGDRVTLCGGLADREFGHWVKHIFPGETFTSPEALLTVVAGTLEDACQSLVSLQGISANLSTPDLENDLPVCFNEWCTSWGNPTHENILAIASRLQGCGVRYIVIDDGWAIRPPEALIQSNGDWTIDQDKFPGGLRPTCDALREMGYIPGIWFEFEVINPGAIAWNETAHMLQRDGRPIQVGSRRFWDFSDPWVHEYLSEKVIDLLRNNHIGYLKVDYNDSVGFGCDHPDSLGEGLREHIAGVQRFFRTLRSALPDLVIENCSSGGHRLEPSMQALTSMGSFSDAHEPVIIPLIARNLQRLIQPRQSLIWAVLHPNDDEARLRYSLAATFLGRVCLSGDIHELSDWQMNIVRSALSLYRKCSPIIDLGTSYFHGNEALSYVDPVGWQIVVRVHRDQALVVFHGFENVNPHHIEFQLPDGDWTICDSFCEMKSQLTIEGGTAKLTSDPSFRGAAWLLKKD